MLNSSPLQHACGYFPLLIHQCLSVCLCLQLDLSDNQLCGLYSDSWHRGRIHGTYNAHGIKALSEALKVKGSVTSLSLGQNGLGDEGAAVIAHALKESKVCKLASLDLNNLFSGNTIGPAGAKALAEYLSVTASMTRLDVKFNSLGGEGEAVLRKAIEGRSGFELLLRL